VTSALLLFAYFGLLYVTKGRVRQVLMLIPLALDCVGSVLVGESFGNTLSAKAHDARQSQHPVWRWTAAAIDAVFFLQPDHCRVQWERERQHGSVWAAWLADWRAA
jgi:hypothetical protein